MLPHQEKPPANASPSLGGGASALKRAALITLALALLTMGTLTAAVINATSTIPWWQPPVAESLRGAAP